MVRFWRVWLLNGDVFIPDAIAVMVPSLLGGIGGCLDVCEETTMGLKQVLYVQPVGRQGDAESVLLTLLRGLDRRRFLPHVVCLEDGPFVQAVQETGALVSLIPAGRYRHFPGLGRTVGAISRYMRRVGIDLVHSNGDRAHLCGGMAACFTRCPAIWHLQDLVSLDRMRIDQMVWHVPVSLMFAASEFMRGEVLARRPDCATEVVAVAPGVDAVGVFNPRLVFPEQVLRLRAELDLGDAGPIVLVVARLQQWQGVQVFVEAVAQLRRRWPYAVFVVAGAALFGLERDCAEVLRCRVDALGVADQVRLVGHCDDMPCLFALADVVVHPTIAPDLSCMTVIEAMAMERPVIVPAVGGSSEAVLHGRTGLLIPPGDPSVLAEALDRLLSVPSYAQQLGQCGREHVLGHYTQTHLCQRVEQMYLRVLGNSQRAAA